MVVHFTEEEKEWIVEEPFNWHIAEGCPEIIAGDLRRKLDLLYASSEGVVRGVQDEQYVVKNDLYGIQLMDPSYSGRHIAVMVANWKSRFDALDDDIIRSTIFKEIQPEDRYYDFIDMKSRRCIGFGSLKHAPDNCLEVGYEIIHDMQNKGVGGACVPLFIGYLRETCDKKLIAKVYSNNAASIKILKQVGGREIATEESDYAKFIKKAVKLIDSDRQVAEGEIANDHYTVTYQL